ncbi:MAG: acyl-CoA desaturase [Nitrospiraceae bacterium]|nr:acyl-CoA desaturase [Nitrospiraceae bacterium]
MTPQSPTIAITHTGIPIKISSRRGIWTAILFCTITMGAVIGIPLYGYFYHYIWLDWSLFGLLYVVSELGITVGYHRLMAHRGFDCPNWVKGLLLIGGAWALQNSAIKWTSDHLRHHAHCDEEKDPYNAQQGFWHSHCGWLFTPDRYADPKCATRVANDSVAIWQHKYYPLLLAGLGRTFAVLNSTFFINSVCHLWGQQPHGTSDSSRDNWLVSLVTFGEGYHNYHHMYPTDYRNGPRWHHFDPSKWLIHGLYSLGLATSLRTGSYVKDLLVRTN